MEALFGILLLMALMIFGVPVAWSFAGVLMFLVWAYDVSTSTLLLQGFRSLDSVILLALPLFVLAGYLMQSGGVAARLISFMSMAMRGRKGGLGAALIGSSGVFGAISGTATAAVASIGTIMGDPLAARGYPRGYTSALLGVSSGPFRERPPRPLPRSAPSWAIRWPPAAIRAVTRVRFWACPRSSAS